MTGGTLPEAQWQLLGERVAAWTGLAWSGGRTRELRQAVAAASTGLGAADADACARRLLAHEPAPQDLEVLAHHLTVGETYFFRDPKTMDALASEILPALFSGPSGSRKRLRLWSAGCCTGEEPYSLAILMHRMGTAQPPWDVRVLATDINTQFLEKARAGLYGDWSFRGDPYRLRNRWFHPAPDRRQAIVESVKNMVDFSHDNLARVPEGGRQAESGMDLVVCRNVLMYLSPQALAGAVERFRRALLPGGWLVVSPSEASDVLFPGLIPVTLGGVRFYRKPLPGHRTRPAPAIIAPRELPVPHESRSPLTQPAPPPALRASVVQAGAPVLPGVTAAPDATAARARSLAGQGRLDEARACCEQWIAAEPLQARARYLHAVVLIEQNERARAREELVRAVYLDADFVMAHLALGRLCQEAAHPSAARRHFSTARRLLVRCPADGEVTDADGVAAGQLLDMLDGLDQTEVLS